MKTNQSTISVVTITVAVLAALCVSTICWLSYSGIQIPPELNTLTGTLCGYLTGALSKTTPTEMTKAPDAPPPNGAHITATIDNPPSDPVPTTTKKT